MSSGKQVTFIGLALTLVLGVGGCAQKAAPRTSGDTMQQRAPGQDTMTEETLRAELMSLSDRFGQTTLQGIIALERGLGTHQARITGLEYRVYTLPAASEIAISPNVSTALIDMLVLATLNRTVWEDHWRDEVFGKEAEKAVAAMRLAEQDAWQVGAKVMSPTQLQELRGIIEQWRREHPDQFGINHMRLAEFNRTGRLGSLAAVEQPGGFFGVGRALSAVEESQRMLERTLWFVTRLQIVAGWQAELAYTRVVGSPEITTTLKRFDEVAGLLPTLPENIADRSLTVSRELMREVTVERQAAINQILEGFASERRATLATLTSEAGPRAALYDARVTIEATTQLVERLDALMTRLEPLMGGAKSDAPPGRPFNILEYRDTVAEASRTVDRLNELVGSVNGTLASPAMEEGLPRLVQEGQGLVDRTFRSGLLLLAIFLGGLLFVMVAYRWVALRLTPHSA